MGRKAAAHPLLGAFTSHLLKKQISSISVKNYRADIGQFLKWYESATGKEFLPDDLSAGHIHYYKRVKDVSSSSLQRHISSLRKFIAYLSEEDLLDGKKFSFLEKGSANIKKDNLRDFVLFLYVEQHSKLTVKQYRIGVNQFLHWVKDNNPAAWASWGSDKLASHLNNALVDAYLSQVSRQFGYSEATVQKRRAAVRKYMEWLEKNGGSAVSLLLVLTLALHGMRFAN